MKIAVSSSGNTLESPLDPRFGRCAYFVIVDSDNMNFEAFDNESIALGGGAGIQAAQFVASKGAKAVLTGNVGPNAMKTLQAAGLQVFAGQSGTVKDAIENFITGTLSPTGEANVADHYGHGRRQQSNPFRRGNDRRQRWWRHGPGHGWRYGPMQRPRHGPGHGWRYGRDAGVQPTCRRRKTIWTG